MVLKLVTEAIERVQVGTDRTAAELAIIRHERELTELLQMRAALQRRIGPLGFAGIALFSFLMMISLIGEFWTLSISLLLGLCACLKPLVVDSPKQVAQRDALNKAIEGVQQLLTEKRQIVDCVKCPRCGHRNDVAWKFCGSCSASLELGKAPEMV